MFDSTARKPAGSVPLPGRAGYVRSPRDVEHLVRHSQADLERGQAVEPPTLQ